MTRWVGIAGVVCALLAVGVIAFTTAQPDSKPGTLRHVVNIQGGQVPDLVVLDDSYERWAVAPVHLEASPGNDVVDVVFDTQDCKRSGAVGYRLIETSREVRVTVVAGETGSCFSTVDPHPATIRLDSPLRDRQLVAVQPNYNFR